MFPKRSALGFLLLFSIFTLPVADDTVADKKDSLRCLSTKKDNLTIIDEDDTKLCFLSLLFEDCDQATIRFGYKGNAPPAEALVVEDGVYLSGFLHSWVFSSNISLKLDGSLKQVENLIFKSKERIFEQFTPDKCSADKVVKQIEKEYFGVGKILDPERVKGILPTTTTTTTTTEIPSTTKISTSNAPTTSTTNVPVTQNEPTENFMEQTTIDDMSTTSMAIATGMLSVVFITLSSLF